MLSLCPVKRLSLLCAALAALCGCIERPWQDQPSAHPAIDRSRLAGVLVTAPPANLIPVGAIFGNAAELVGYTMEPRALVQGERTRLTFYWRCLAELEPWHIFVHLDDANGSGERIHAEHEPAQGRYPTDAWLPGDLVADPIVFVPGRSPLFLFLGFYTQGDTRLPLTTPGRGRDDGQSRLLVGTLQIAR